jgi:hypothetical protein
MTGLIAGLLPAAFGLTSLADATSGTLFFTTFAGGPNVHKVSYSFDGAATFSLGAPVNIASTAGADGIVFNPNNGNILIGGQGPFVHEIKTDGTPVASVDSKTIAFHLSVDPSKTIVWAAGIPGPVSEVPLTPSVTTGTAYTMLGDESGIDTIAWRGATAVYTSSDPNGGEFYGYIVLDTTAKTATTTRVGSQPASHGLTYDPFTDDFIFIGDDHITQLDGATLALVSDLEVPGVNFDQGTVDGKGHGFFADNLGKLVFLDYSGTGLVGDALNFLASPFLANSLDDVAPLIGPGGSNVPEADTTIAGIGLLAAAGLAWRRARNRQQV